MESLSVNGIPTFYERHEGTGEIAIVFRSGIADEPLPLRGINHLVEHLAMYGWAERSHAANAEVSLQRCSFGASGTVEELASFASNLNAALAALPMERLENEKRVLRVESGERAPSFAQRLLSLRFGLRGAGVAYAPEIGLDHLERARIDEWREERFTAANAAIWIAAPSMPEIDLRLPPGRRWPMDEGIPLSGLEFPAAVPEGSGGVGFGVVIERTPTAYLAFDVLDEMLLDALRTRNGLTYETLTSIERIAPNHLHFAIGAECRDVDSDLVVETALETIRGLAAAPPDEELVERVRGRWLRHFEDSPDRHQADLMAAVSGELFGAEVTVAGWNAEYRSATPEDVSSAWGAAIDSLLALVPVDARKPDGLEALRRPVPEIVAPRFKVKYRSAFMHVDIGPEGLAIEDVDDEHAAIRSEELVMSQRRSTGEFELLGVDETMITIDPMELKDGEVAIAALEALVKDSFVAIHSPVGERVEQLVEEKLKRRWLISDELEVLAGYLEDPELPVNIAQVVAGTKVGLLALTERRLIWIYSGLKREETEAFPLHQISNPRVYGVARDSIKFEINGETKKFKGFTPRARTNEFLAAMKAGETASE